MSFNSMNILAREGEDLSKPKILICAPTGKAASLVGKCFVVNFVLQNTFNKSYVGGTTLHKAFGLAFGGGPKKKNEQSEQVITVKEFVKYADKLEELKLIIIDEVSMMDSKLLYTIHNKMCSVMDKPTDVMFGGVSVVLVGDLLQVSGYYYLRNLRIQLMLV